MNTVQNTLNKVLDLGGPVVLLLLAVSVLTSALVLYKIWQYRAARVGQHRALAAAVAAWDRGEAEAARRSLSHSKSYLVPVMRLALDGTPDHMQADRADAEAEERFSHLERGLGTLDMVAQLAPLLGLFGTVIGMIEAFRKLQSAGASVDPSLLAGGIWVALLTTAAGLAVAMPVSLVLSWLTARMQRERVFANRALRTVFAPSSPVQSSPAPANAPLQVAHGG
ncbi:MotA/TolQ/ExbB proton channel family protein [Leisingera sp. NJS204]|uniref:MotA/TolQ/ExbB proton channel family protein n=1 Tax=Leisingera sp. NJS204 TaxID=2508307 RepID=UPI0010131285|nr:MotA/TolQ/ExbB proton channel family protein [Leisingera sp. NJS204]QAX32242.1 MotA/TolQ/ExbB proton channel family protein [Leisingera sp. NJS204]